MVVDPSGPAIDLYVPVEVVIGSIPLRQIAEQHGMVLPPPPPPPDPSLPPPAPGVPAGLYTDANLPQNMRMYFFAEENFLNKGRQSPILTQFLLRLLVQQ